MPWRLSTFSATFVVMENEFSSSLLENAVNEMAKLPGIGRKTALRLILHLLRQDKTAALSLGDSIIKLREGIRYCSVCHNISETDRCPICSDTSRDASTVCVVENVKDVMVVENTRQYHGLYHVLGGLISPMDGIGPQDVEIESLVKRVEAGGVKEVILALSATMEGDTTNFYIFRKLAGSDVWLWATRLSIQMRLRSDGQSRTARCLPTVSTTLLNERNGSRTQ